MIRAEVLGAIERRRRWRYEDKVRIVEQSFAAGVMTVTDVARRNGVAASVVFTWRRQAKLGSWAGQLGASAAAGRTGSCRDRHHVHADIRGRRC
jgi:transposase-like protein